MSDTEKNEVKEEPGAEERFDQAIHNALHKAAKKRKTPLREYLSPSAIISNMTASIASR